MASRGDRGTLARHGRMDQPERRADFEREHPEVTITEEPGGTRLVAVIGCNPDQVTASSEAELLDKLGRTPLGRHPHDKPGWLRYAWGHRYDLGITLDGLCWFSRRGGGDRQYSAKPAELNQMLVQDYAAALAGQP